MDQHKNKSTSEHGGRTVSNINLNERLCSVDHIIDSPVQSNFDTIIQNNIDVNNTTPPCQINQCDEENLVFYHERTSSCESATSSLSSSSYNSSNASGILLNVSSLGPDPKQEEVKFNFQNSSDITKIEYDITEENIVNLNVNCFQGNTEIENSIRNCDVLSTQEENTIISHTDINNANKKPDLGCYSNNSNNKSKDSQKSKKLLDFSVIKLRGKNILLHKHDSIKMGQSANNTSSDFTTSSDNIISSCQQNIGMNSNESSNTKQLKTHITCDNSSRKMDEIDNRLIDKRPDLKSQSPITCQSTVSLSTTTTDFSKSSSFLKLEAELEKSQKELQLKEEEVIKLSRIRDEVESEMTDLTASLFTEAHRMVGEANVKRASAEKYLVESNMKIDGLETEVAALKTLVLTSTPSQPNRHLHPQLTARDSKNNTTCQMKSNGQGSNNSLLQGNLKPSKTKSPMGSISSLSSLNASSIVIGAGGLNNCTTLNSSAHSTEMTGLSNNPNDSNLDLGDQHSTSTYSNGALVPVGCTPNSGGEMRNVDPNLHQEYLEWKKSPSLVRNASDFLSRIYKEDIDLCIDFPIESENTYLKSDLHEAIHQQSICITPLKPEKNEYKKHCPLLNSKNVLCKFHVRLGLKDIPEDRNELIISQLARNRITAVCNFLNYLNYIIKGLVKSHHNDVYWEILYLRKSMVLARFGFSPD